MLATMDLATTGRLVQPMFWDLGALTVPQLSLLFAFAVNCFVLVVFELSGWAASAQVKADAETARLLAEMWRRHWESRLALRKQHVLPSCFAKALFKHMCFFPQ